MKKLLILCLMLLLCCAFAACGGDSEQEAIDAVGGQSGPSVSTTGTPSIKNVPKDAYGQYEKAEVEAALPLFCGTWQGYFDEEGQIVTIDDDGSCTVQGEELSWELRSIDTEDGEAVLKLLRGKDGVYTLYVETEPLPYGENTYQFVHMRGDEGTVIGNLYRPEQVELVEVSTANWGEYMEAVSYVAWEDNAFGEAIDASYWTCWSMKDAYAERLLDADLAFEYSYDHAAIYAQNIDLANRSFSLGELYGGDAAEIGFYSAPDTKTHSERFTGYFYQFNDLNILSEKGSSYNNDGWIAPADNFTILRVEGSILLLK